MGTVYPDYPELAQAARPPLLRELGLGRAGAAGPSRPTASSRRDTVELSRAEWPPLAAAEPAIEALVRGTGSVRGGWVYTRSSRR